MKHSTIARYYAARSLSGPGYHPGKLHIRTMSHPKRAARVMEAVAYVSTMTRRHASRQRYIDHVRYGRTPEGAAHKAALRAYLASAWT